MPAPGLARGERVSPVRPRAVPLQRGPATLRDRAAPLPPPLSRTPRPREEARRSRPGLAALAGLAVFLLTCGPAILDPRAVGWMAQGDAAAYLLGWHYYRDVPWSWPPGASPAYGMELGSAIFYVDAVPLLALPLKALSAWWPVGQYSGPWLLACFVLQGVAGWLLLGLATRDAVPRLLGAALLLFTPAFLSRVDILHYSLVAHWLVLLGLFLAIAPPRRVQPWLWAGLLALAAGVQPYLLVMVAALWASDLLRRALAARPRSPAAALPALAELAGVPLAPALTLYLAGAFTVRGGLAGTGYGSFRLNLLGLLDPDGWSRLLPDLPRGNAFHDGTSYLGLGLLLLLAAAALAVLRRPARSLLPAAGRWPLLLVLLALTGFALTHRLSLGALEWRLPLPRAAEALANVLRSSDRMIWPATYALALLAVSVLARRLPRRPLAGLLAAALALQAWDTSAAWQPMRERHQAAPRDWPARLRAPVWDALAPHYGALRRLPPQNEPDNWIAATSLAAAHGLPTEVAYLSRPDSRGLAARRGVAAAILAGRPPERDALYLLGRPAMAAALALLREGGDDLVAEADGMLLLAPGGRALGLPPAAALGAREIRAGMLPLPLLTPGGTLRFGVGEAGQAGLLDGWARPDRGWVWTEAEQAGMVVRLAGPLPPVLRLTLHGRALVLDRLPGQRVEVLANGHPVATLRLALPTGRPATELLLDREWLTPVPGGWLLHLLLGLPDAARPIDLGINADLRPLGLALEALELAASPGAEEAGPAGE